MLKDVIDFVKSRTDLTDREIILREINYAWQEVWNSDDLPNSMFETSVKISDPTAARLALPYFVGKIRAVKGNDRLRTELNTMRPWYHNSEYYQSPYTWRLLGTNPLKTSITNATRLIFSIPAAETQEFTVTLIGTSDHSAQLRDQLVFPVGTTEMTSNYSYSNLESVYKDKLLAQNVSITGENGEDFGFIPNLANTVRHQIIQVHDRCTLCCATCRCYDVLYKIPAPVLYYDEQEVIDEAYQNVLMTKTLEWIQMAKVDSEKSVEMFAEKSKDLQDGFNANNVPGLAHKIDLAPNRFNTWTGYWDRKI